MINQIKPKSLPAPLQYQFCLYVPWIAASGNLRRQSFCRGACVSPTGDRQSGDTIPRFRHACSVLLSADAAAAKIPF
jgi:hypothetical protein